MGLLLSILITCVGVLEVIACYTHFRVGVAYSECKSNIRDIAKCYALELRKHELHFEPGPDEGGGEGTSQETLSELVRKRIRSTIRVQEKNRNGQIAQTASNGHALGASCSTTPDQTATPNYSNLVVPRNSISGLDSPTVQTLMSPDVNITEAVTEKIHRLESTESWGRKSPSPLPEKTGLEVVEKDFWRSRSPSPFPEVNGESVELKYTPGFTQHRAASPLLDSLAAINGNLQGSPSGSELVDKDYWNNTSIPGDAYSKTDLEIQDILPLETSRSYSITDLEVQNLTRGLDQVPRQPSPTPNPEILFGMTNDEESKFDEEFLRSLDGVKISKCDDRRRSFRKKRNSSSTSSRASREDLRSIISTEDIESSDRKEDLIPPLAEEDIETIVSEKCESLKSPPPAQSNDEVKVTHHEQTHFKASESTSTSDINKPTNLSFTEKVKDLEINVQLLVTVKGTSQGDQMQYTTSVAQQQTKPLEHVPKPDDNTITKSTEEKSEFGKVKTSVTYGQANVPNFENSITGENLKPIDKINELKDLQISSQSLIHAERAVQDNVKSSEDEFMKLYESFTELPPREKDKFLKIIEQSNKDCTDSTITQNLENPPAETEEIQTVSDKQTQEVIKIQQQITNTDDSKNVSQETKIEKEKSAVDKNVTDPNNKEIILVKEITEITESTETVMKLPPATKQSQNINPAQSAEIISKLNISLNEQNTGDTTETEIICDTDKSKSTTIVQELENSKEVPDRVDNTLENNNFTPEEKPISNETSNEEIRTTTITSSKPEENKEQTQTEIKEELTTKTTIIEDKKTDLPKVDSSSSSSETPITVVENALRRASKTAFEDATEIQNQEMIKRRVSNSEISPKQATQAFWLIFSAEYTNAMEKDWHGQHFSCWQCDESLTGQRYVLREEHPYCVKCYEGVFANTCEKCNRIIGIDSKDLSYKDKHWHEACFQCTSCNESLVDKQFGAKGEKIYCGKCYDKQFASKCDGCGKIFHAGTKKMEYKNRQWHEQCFKCCKCDTPIGTKSFIPREKEIYCAGCYEEKYATRCFKCEKAIQSGGVTYKNQPWHRECFTCTHCNKNLAGQRFTSRDDKPCCAECFGRLFAKRCTSCKEPITGIGGTRFISFEDRHWHNDCFICATCSTTLVGRGFITDEDKIICPECAKERFM